MCTEIWIDGENPYCSNHETSRTRFCSGGMVNITGTNLSGIMKTMNFAFHSATDKDFDGCTENIFKANITYTPSSSKVVSIRYTSQNSSPFKTLSYFFSTLIKDQS